MAKKSNNVRKKNYNNRSIKSIDKNLENSKVFNTKKIMAKHAVDSSLEETNVQEFHFDDNMLNDFDSLDTSFMEKGSNSKKKKRVKKEFKSYDNKKKKEIKKTKFRSINFFALFVVVLLSIFLGGILTYLCFYDKFTRTKEITRVEIKEKPIVDENIVFVGDSLIFVYDLDKYYVDRKTVNSGVNSDTTDGILDNMEDRIFKYNPSKVIILIGTNDLGKGRSIEKISFNLENIVVDIKKNRKLSEIYVVSLLPINNDSNEDKIDLDMVSIRTNSNIKKVNKEYKKICDRQKVNYIDVYDKLLDEDGNLDIDYTVEGLHLTSEGYKILTSSINDSIGK